MAYSAGSFVSDSKAPGWAIPRQALADTMRHPGIKTAGGQRGFQDRPMGPRPFTSLSPVDRFRAENENLRKLIVVEDLGSKLGPECKEEFGPATRPARIKKC